jgi:Flp pilus assembly protein TadG
VETALVLPTLLFLLIGVFAFTYVSYVKAAVTEAARDAARTAAVRYDLPGERPQAAGREAARETLDTAGLNSAAAAISVEISGGQARAAVSYPMLAFVPGLGRLLGGGDLSPPRIASEAAAVLEPEFLR